MLTPSSQSDIRPDRVDAERPLRHGAPEHVGDGPYDGERSPRLVQHREVLHRHIQGAVAKGDPAVEGLERLEGLGVGRSPPEHERRNARSTPQVTCEDSCGAQRS